KHGDTKYQNVYQSGYFHYDSGAENFTEWDMGFDFYAPQTFEVPDGRRIIIGWMGIGDIPYNNPTVPLGYQHCLTIPRELSVDVDGTLLQDPIRELCSLRKGCFHINDGESLKTALSFELTAKVGGGFRILLDSFMIMSWNGNVFELRFTDEKFGGGRTVRKALLDKCSDIRIIADKSSVEIYLDGGRTVLSSRMYPDSNEAAVSVEGINADVFPLKEMEMKYLGE
ncbi:MAG: GH32 C-terminal domain-containing protein, partial [Clostridia bacterium]|nr:GH32 C-terminal domain-containing protein [Clostridia bacterium]